MQSQKNKTQGCGSTRDPCLAEFSFSSRSKLSDPKSWILDLVSAVMTKVISEGLIDLLELVACHRLYLMILVSYCELTLTYCEHLVVQSNFHMKFTFQSPMLSNFDKRKRQLQSFVCLTRSLRCLTFFPVSESECYCLPFPLSWGRTPDGLSFLAFAKPSPMKWSFWKK